MKITVGEIEQMAKEQAPSSESPFATSIVGEDSRTKAESPFWTGWKADIDKHCFSNGPDVVIDFPEGPIGFVGQWIYLGGNPPGSANLSVNLPGMEADTFGHGGHFSIGTERVYADTPPETLERIIEAGYAKLLEWVEEDKSKAA